MEAYAYQFVKSLKITGNNLPLPPQSNYRPCPLIIDLLLNLRAEADGTHDSISKLLIQNRLVRISIGLDDLIQSVNQWLRWWHRRNFSTVWESGKLGSEQAFLNFQ